MKNRRLNSSFNNLNYALACALFTSPIIVYAEISELAPIEVTSATQTKTQLEKIPVSVEVIDEQQIQQNAAVTLQDVLYNSGVFFNASQGSVTNNNGQFSIRGVSAKGTLLLINGRRVGSEFTKAFDAQRIPASAIERVEIVKGPMGGLYGSDALGGVINIITKKPYRGHQGTISVTQGANQDGQAQQSQLEASAQGQVGKTGYSVWFSAIKNGKYSETETANIRVPKGGNGDDKTNPSKPSESNIKINTETNQTCSSGENCTPIGNLVNDRYLQDVYYRDPGEVINIGAEIEHQLQDDLILNFSLSYMEEIKDHQGIAKVYASNYQNAGNGKNINFSNVPFAETWHNDRLAIGVGATWQATPDLEIDWQSSISKYRKKESVTSLLWQEQGYESQAASAGLSGDGTVDATQHSLRTTWLALENHRVLLGAEYYLDDREAAFFSRDGKVLSKTQDNRSIYAQDEWQLNDKTTILYGMRYDDTSAAGSATTGHIGSTYQLSQAANLRARYAQGFRAPDSQENYINRFNPQGKAFVGAQIEDASIGKEAFNLKAEQSENIEIGISGNSDNWHYDLALFYTEIEDNILKYTPEGKNYLSFRNASKVELKGLDFSTQYRFSRDLNLHFSLNLLDSHDQDTGRSLEYTPETRAGLSIDYQMTDALNAVLRARYVGEQTYSDTQQGETIYFTADAYQPIDVKFNYALDNTDLFFGVDNLFTSEIDPALGNDIGRYFYAGIRWYLD